METEKKNKIYYEIREKNHRLNQWEQYYRINKLESLPVFIQFPTGTRCNLKCRFCTDRSGSKALTDYKDMSFFKYREVMEKKGGLKDAFIMAIQVSLFGWGEPLVNPDYRLIFDYTTEHFPGLGIVICTNGVMFTTEWAEKIIAVPNSAVNFSLNAAWKETFYNLTSSQRFGQVIDNIKYLTELRRNRNYANPSVTLSFVANTENIKELPDFIDLAADLRADSVLIQDIMLLNEETSKLSLMKYPGVTYKIFQRAEQRARMREIKTFSYVTHLVDYFKKYDKFQKNILNNSEFEDGVPSPYFSHTDCFDPWTTIMLGDNGEVFPCCRLSTLEGESMGNLFHQSLQKVWNGSAYRFLRQTVNTSNPPPACAICPRKAGLDY